MSRPRKHKGLVPNLYQERGYFYYRDPSTGKKFGLGRDKAQAMHEARAANAVLATQTPSSLVARLKGEETLADWIPTYRDAWIKQVAPKPSTIRLQDIYINRITRSEFARRPLHDYTTSLVAQYLTEVQEESGVVTARAVRSRLSDMFRMAKNQGKVKENPVADTYRPDYEVARERLLWEDFLRIRACAAPWVQRAMNLALLTGQRRESLAAMQFADVQDGFLYVVQGKTGQRLQIDLDIRLSVAEMTIGDAVKACRTSTVSRFMIHLERSKGLNKAGAQVSLTGISGGFANARQKAGIQAVEGRQPPTFHEIRALAERLYREEYGAEFAQRLLGHKTLEMTDKYDDLRGSGWSVVKKK